jgi:hypothetical protein
MSIVNRIRVLTASITRSTDQAVRRKKAISASTSLSRTEPTIATYTRPPPVPMTVAAATRLECGRRAVHAPVPVRAIPVSATTSTFT